MTSSGSGSLPCRAANRSAKAAGASCAKRSPQKSQRNQRPTSAKGCRGSAAGVAQEYSWRAFLPPQTPQVVAVGASCCFDGSVSKEPSNQTTSVWTGAKTAAIASTRPGAGVGSTTSTHQDPLNVADNFVSSPNPASDKRLWARSPTVPSVVCASGGHIDISSLPTRPRCRTQGTSARRRCSVECPSCGTVQ